MVDVSGSDRYALDMAWGWVAVEMCAFAGLLAAAGCADAPSTGMADGTEVRDGAVDSGEDAVDSGGDGAVDSGGDDAVDSGGDDAVEVVPFVPGGLLEVDIAMKPADWDALRHQTRALFDVLGPDCLAAPPDKVFTWFAADVTVDGARAHDVGIRKKGFLGSLDELRPSLKLEADELVDGQRLGGLERLTLNNGRQDPSRLRQCLAYDVFRAAGVPAPRCNFAHVTLNGLNLGLYVHVEEVKKRFLVEHFGEPLGEAWEGQLSDFRDGWLDTFEPELADTPDRAPLEAVVDALAVDDEGLLAALDRVVDLDAFMTFWAAESLVAHWDGYSGNTNNFFVYFDPSDARLRFIPWGTDGAFVVQDPQAPASVQATGALAHRLYAHPEGRRRYHAALRRLLDEVWDEDALAAQIDAWWPALAGAREVDGEPAASEDVAALRAFIAGRRAAIEAELAAPPDWPAPLREPICAKARGQVEGSFQTTWGTLAVDNLFLTGSGLLEFTSDALPPLDLGPTGAKAGEDLEGLPGRAQIAVASIVELGGVQAGFVAIIIQTAMPLAAGVLPFDHRTTEAYVYYVEAQDSAQFLGVLGDGALTLEAADVLNGASVSGTFEGTLFAFF